MADVKMSSNRPYLLRAMYEWIVDNQCTPHLLVDVSDDRVKVPREHVRDGQIVLNINPTAVGQFHWDNDHVEFSARFAGVSRSMWIPMSSVLAIYARENGEGMAFTVDADEGQDDGQESADVESQNASSQADGDDETPPPAPVTPIGSRSHLKVVK